MTFLFNFLKLLDSICSVIFKRVNLRSLPYFLSSNCNIIYNYILCNFNNLNEPFFKTLENETNNLFIQIRNDYEYNLLEQKYILKKKLIHYENIKQKKRMFLLNLIIAVIFVFTVFCTTIIFNNFNDTNKMHLMHDIHNKKQCILHTQLYNKHEKLKNMI